MTETTETLKRLAPQFVALDELDAAYTTGLSAEDYRKYVNSMITKTRPLLDAHAKALRDLETEKAQTEFLKTACRNLELALLELADNKEPAKCACVGVEIGSYDNQVKLNAPTHMENRAIDCHAIGETICVDRCIAEEVLFLWSSGVFTTGCCCGHNKLIGYIGVVGDDSVSKMQALGYLNLPGRNDHFYPKSLLKELGEG